MNSSGNVGQFNLKVDKFVTTIDGDYFVFAKYNEDTSTVKEGTRFLIDGGAFEVVGCDSITTVLNGNGYLRFHVKPDLIRDSDSTNTGVADNNKQKSSRDKLW
jgi:exopolysaccharide biosynthesis protein